MAAKVQNQIFKNWTPRIERVAKRMVQRQKRKVHPFEATEGRAKTRDPEVLPIHLKDTDNMKHQRLAIDATASPSLEIFRRSATSSNN